MSASRKAAKAGMSSSTRASAISIATTATMIDSPTNCMISC
jgi:hypothetical protein